MVRVEITREQDTLTDLKEAEFKRGDRPDGSEIGTYRSSAYSVFKSRKNPLAGGYVDLILTGAFVNSTFLKKPVGDRYLFGFRDHKAPMLLQKYGADIAGLNQDAFNRFQLNIIKPRFVQKIKKTLGQ